MSTQRANVPKPATFQRLNNTIRVNKERVGVGLPPSYKRQQQEVDAVSTENPGRAPADKDVRKADLP